MFEPICDRNNHNFYTLREKKRRRQKRKVHFMYVTLWTTNAMGENKITNSLLKRVCSLRMNAWKHLFSVIYPLFHWIECRNPFNRTKIVLVWLISVSRLPNYIDKNSLSHTHSLFSTPIAIKANISYVSFLVRFIAKICSQSRGNKFVCVQKSFSLFNKNKKKNRSKIYTHPSVRWIRSEWMQYTYKSNN